MSEVRALPEGIPGYIALAADVRRDIESGAYAQGRRMPTEEQLRQSYGVSRHTVRAALKQLIAEGLVYQKQGSGTYVSGRQDGGGPYLRTIGALDEIIVWPETRMEILEPFHRVVNSSIAARLELGFMEVGMAVVRRHFADRPFVLTKHFVEPSLGERLNEEGIPSEGAGTVIGEAEPFLAAPVAGARQDITSLIAPDGEAQLIGCESGDAMLLIERLYYDSAGTFVEFTQSLFNPRRYTYRMDLRRR